MTHPTPSRPDPAYPFVGHAWRDTTSVYGPVFTLASEPIGRAVGASADAAARAYKALAALAVLVAAALAAHLARRKPFALAFVGWNPLLALNFAGSGHNDSWVAAVVLAAGIRASLSIGEEVSGVARRTRRKRRARR